MIRTCNGCKALDDIRYPNCMLGYAIKPKKHIDGFVVEYSPKDGECPKPKNNDMLVFLLLEKNK